MSQTFWLSLTAVSLHSLAGCSEGERACRERKEAIVKWYCRGALKFKCSMQTVPHIINHLMSFWYLLVCKYQNTDFCDRILLLQFMQQFKIKQCVKNVYHYWKEWTKICVESDSTLHTFLCKFAIFKVLYLLDYPKEFSQTCKIYSF